MKGLKKKRRIQLILLSFVALLGATVLIGYAMKDGINFFRTRRNRLLPRDRYQ